MGGYMICDFCEAELSKTKDIKFCIIDGIPRSFCNKNCRNMFYAKITFERKIKE
jgi:ribosomal protein L24E